MSNCRAAWSNLKTGGTSASNLPSTETRRADSSANRHRNGGQVRPTKMKENLKTGGTRAPGQAIERCLRTLLRLRQQAAAKNIRLLTALSVSTRKTIDTMIATCSIMGGYKLLYRGRTYAPNVKHRIALLNQCHCHPHPKLDQGIDRVMTRSIASHRACPGLDPGMTLHFLNGSGIKWRNAFK